MYVIKKMLSLYIKGCKNHLILDRYCITMIISCFSEAYNTNKMEDDASFEYVQVTCDLETR